MLFIANWKMEKSFAQSIDDCATHTKELKQLSAQQDTEIVLCPSFPALYTINEMLADTMVHLGAQTCSPHASGAYTGQVSAQSLQEIGCSYCIVGHSEQRQYQGVTDQEVADAAYQLCEQRIEPIICIGETKDQFQKKEGMKVVEQQLDPVLSKLKNTQQPITIAYEPVWAIGTGQIPESDYLTTIFQHLSTILSDTHSEPWRLIYGGSVSEKTIGSFKNIPTLSGFLIGGASLDFQKFEKIVSLAK